MTDLILPTHWRFKNLMDQEFDRLTVVGYGGTTGKQNKTVWNCRCSCDGKIIPVTASNLQKRITKSCGCWKIEMLVSRRLTHGQSRGREVSPEYATWQDIKKRIFDENCDSYQYYGGRGIKMCEKWVNDFQSFLDCIGRKNHPSDSIDRFPDVNGNYEPGNVRWATPKEQARNKRNNFLVTLNGITKCSAEWEEITGIKSATIRARKAMGWSDEKALTTPVGPNGRKRSIGD